MTGGDKGWVPDPGDVAATSWLGRELQLTEPLATAPIAGGWSNITYLVTDGTGRCVVVRRPPNAPSGGGAHDVLREATIVSALRDTAVPVPVVVAQCADPAVAPHPFYATEFRPGVVVRSAAVAATVPVERRRPLGFALVDVLADLQAVDLDAVGLASLRRRTPYLQRQVRRWSERWRATALAARSAPLRDDKELTAELEALRSVSRLLRETEITASRRNALEREQRRLEAAVQARTRRLPGRHEPGEGQFNLEELFDEIGPATLIELVTVDGVLHVVVVADRRVRLHTVGSVPEHEVQLNRFALRRLARGRRQPGDEIVLKSRGAALEAALLGSAAAGLGDSPVVVIPPARFRAVPWTLMPSLRDRVVTVAPSASAWLRARRMRPPSPRRVALVTGPGLATKGAEIESLRSRYPGAMLLGHGNATAGQVLTALDGAWLAHIAAHGTFRTDNPMFSSILLDDGPLIVHDFERLGRAPYHLVLAGCDSGVAAPVGADELLGLVSSLMPLGAAGIVASVVPVNDIAVVPVMVALHEALQRGATLPEALLAARRAAGDDPLAEATAHSFLALGA